LIYLIQEGKMSSLFSAHLTALMKLKSFYCQLLYAQSEQSSSFLLFQVY
jgi:hypothetical protein